MTCTSLVSPGDEEIKLRTAVDPQIEKNGVIQLQLGVEQTPSANAARRAENPRCCCPDQKSAYLEGE